jgi:hypothetical protein
LGLLGGLLVGKIYAGGKVFWQENGVCVCDTSDNSPVIVSDNNYGAIIYGLILRVVLFMHNE